MTICWEIKFGFNGMNENVKLQYHCLWAITWAFGYYNSVIEGPSYHL